MKPVTHPVKSLGTAAGNWLTASILAFVLLITVLPGQGQPQAKIDSLLNVIKNAPEDTSLVKDLQLLSNYYRLVDDYEIAIKYADTAVGLARKINWKKGEIQALCYKGAAQNSSGDYTGASSSLGVALKDAEEIGYISGLAKANLELGATFMEQGDYQGALKYLLAGLDISLKTKDTTKLRFAYSVLGGLYRGMGNYPEALRYHFAHLKIVEKQQDKAGMIAAYLNIGIIYDLQENLTEALGYCQEALKLALEINYKRGISRAYNNIGIIYDTKGNNPEAIKHFLLSVKTKEEIGDKEGAASTYSNIGLLYMELNDLSEAERTLQIALKTYQEIGSKVGTAMVYNHLGKLYTLENDYIRARKYIEDGLEIMLEVGNKNKLSNAYRALYELDSAQNNFAEALEHYKRYTQYQDSLFNEESAIKIAELQLQYETEKKDQEIELLNKDNEIKSLQLSRQKAIRHGLSAGIVLLFITGFLLFRSFRLRKKLEQQQAIISERKRISADLHDDVGSGLSRIMLLTELVKREARTPEMKQEAEKIAKISRELSSNISEIIWALNANNDTLESLVAYIRRHAAEFFEDSGLQFRISTPAGIADIPLSGEKRRDIFYTVKEALHNIHKHAQATEAELSFALNGGELAVVVRDNGRGIPEEAKNDLGNGLRNMRQRMESVGGSFSIENHQGTKITLKVPVP